MDIMLITANVGSLFEFADNLMTLWWDKVIQVVDQRRPQFLAIHCQEVGGKNFQRSMKHLEPFVGYILKSPIITQRYRRSCIVCDGAYESRANFTALGNLYFVSDDVPNVEIWNFQNNSFQTLESPQLDIGDIESVTHKLKEKFPPEYFPGDKWSRKGYCLTRWRFRPQQLPLDFVNMHLFHDASNLVAMKNSPSLYSKCRKHALDFTLGRLECNRRECLAALKFNLTGRKEDGVPQIPYFIFGDFNFRLDTHELIKKLTSTGEYGFGPFVLETSCTEIPDDPDPEECGEDNRVARAANVDHFVDGSGCVLKPRNKSDAPTPPNNIPGCSKKAASPAIIRIGKKLFDIPDQHDDLFTPVPDSTPWLLRYDTEPILFHDRLYEYPIRFPPSYPYSEDVSTPSSYMKTRCPGWCDRVLLSLPTKDHIASDKSQEKGAYTYGTIGQSTCMGDHKPVYLSLRLMGPTAGSGSEHNT